jgi:hypothetical protein
MTARIRKPNGEGYMSTAEFRDRIRKLCGVDQISARRSDPCVVRNRKDKGYNPPETKQ